jgi:hypothetical protein
VGDCDAVGSTPTNGVERKCVGLSRQRRTWRVELPACRPTTFHLVHEDKVAEILGIPNSVTQIALLPVAYYTGDDFSPAPRRPATEITYFNRWKQSE